MKSEGGLAPLGSAVVMGDRWLDLFRFDWFGINVGFGLMQRWSIERRKMVCFGFWEEEKQWKSELARVTVWSVGHQRWPEVHVDGGDQGWKGGGGGSGDEEKMRGWEEL